MGDYVVDLRDFHAMYLAYTAMQQRFHFLVFSNFFLSDTIPRYQVQFSKVKQCHQEVR